MLFIVSCVVYIHGCVATSSSPSRLVVLILYEPMSNVETSNPVLSYLPVHLLISSPRNTSYASHVLYYSWNSIYYLLSYTCPEDYLFKRVHILLSFVYSCLPVHCVTVVSTCISSVVVHHWSTSTTSEACLVYFLQAHVLSTI